MQAAAIDHAGDATAIVVRALPVPTPAADEVLIAVQAAGVASWDVSLREHPDMIKHNRFPLVLGTDGAGLVAAVGKDVHDFKVGDKVYSYSWDNSQGGFYAEYVAVPASRVGPVPPGLTLKQAGAIATTALTAIQGIDDALHLKKGQTVIIHGAAGGVGTLAVQFARLRGAHILATVSSEDEIGLVKSLGADTVVDGRHGDLVAAAHAFAPGGADALLVLAGGEAVQAQLMAAVRPGGAAAYPHGVHPVPKPREGVTLIAYDAEPGAQEFARLNQAIEESHLQVPIGAEFPLAQAAQAQQRLEAGHVPGKIVLNIR
ncbi:MAG: NADP-dependent oxidoreductase [Proteobacteria bacterium]|nr:NADP-dependent oxidoreductase [Pseudomonadota bacterium]